MSASATAKGRVSLSAVAITSAALVMAGCGGSASPDVAHLSSTQAASSAGLGGDSPGAASPERSGVAFAQCMRANGEPTFPDPSANGGAFRIGAGVDPSSATFQAAQAKCRKFMPGGGIGSGPPPSAQTLARFLRIAQCMREHGVSQFPDPTTSVPPDPFRGGAGVISDIEGVILVFPSTIDEQSPAFKQAAATCTFPLHNH